MAYSVRVERIGQAGLPNGRPTLYEADSEIEAVTIATYEVDSHRSEAQRVATVSDASGLLILVYVGARGPRPAA